MLIKNYMIGGDHEVFLRNKKTGEIVSAEGIIQGTKYEPFNFDENDRFACTSLDNVLAEYNIAPAKTAAEFYHGIEKALNYINSHIPKGLEVVALPAARLKKKYLKTENTQLFGCEPDFNAWTNGGMNERPKADGDLRSAGLHITVGYDDPNEMSNLLWVRSMDTHIGIPSVLQEPDNERKKLYGKAGAFRHTPFGCEYRSTSNYILGEKKLIDWAFQNTEEAIKFVNEGKSYMIDEERDNIMSAINDKDPDKARYIIDKFQIKMAE